MTHFEEKITYLPNGTEVKVDFKREGSGEVLQDSITLKKEVYESMTHEELDALIDQRFERWVQDVQNPPGVIWIEDEPYSEILESDKDLFENVIEVEGKFYFKIS